MSSLQALSSEDARAHVLNFVIHNSTVGMLRLLINCALPREFFFGHFHYAGLIGNFITDVYNVNVTADRNLLPVCNTVSQS